MAGYKDNEQLKFIDGSINQPIKEIRTNPPSLRFAADDLTQVGTFRVQKKDVVRINWSRSSFYCLTNKNASHNARMAQQTEPFF